MNQSDAAKALTFARGFDSFISVDEVSTSVWALALTRAAITSPVAQEAVLAHYSGPDANRTIEPADVIAYAGKQERKAQHHIDADVRSAKARGLISRDWPMHQELPADVAEALAAARQRDREAVAPYLEVDA